MSAEQQNSTVKYECRFAVYCPPTIVGEADDLHLVKLIKHNNDGTTEPEIKLIQNYKRSYWITKKGFQNHKQHKEWEDKDRLIEYQSTQTQLQENVARSIGFPGFRGSMKTLCENPYIYGTEILSTAILKKQITDKYPDVQTPFSVAVADTETDVINGTKEIIMFTMTYKKHVITAVTKDFLKGEVNVEKRFHEAVDKYLRNIPEVGDVVEKRNLQFTFVVVDNPLEAIKVVINKAHELKPDFLAFWNIDFDITKILDICTKYNIDPKHIFSDPSVPNKYKFFKYKKGPTQKKTASGLVTPIKPAAQWHTVFTPSSFYLVDAMCVYKQTRTGKQEEQSYALDAILKKNELGGKLSFSQCDHLEKLDWHKEMQSNYKIEYIIYNIWDCLSIEMLDDKTSDLKITMPMFSGFSDFQHFNSQPRRAVDALHYFCLNNNKVIGTTPPKNKKEKNNSSDDEDGDSVTGLDISSEPLTEEEMNEMTLSLRGWIITLPAHLVMDNGLKCIEEFPDLKTNCHIHVGD